MKRKAAKNAGFTLMEVMIAVAIVSIMGGLIYASFGPMLRAKEVIEAESEHYRGIQVALTRMSREISMAFMSNDFDHTRWRDKSDMPTFFSGDSEQLSFTAFAHQRRYKDAKESDQAVFEYRVGRNPEAELGESTHDVLIRRENPLLEAETDSCKRGGGRSDDCGVEMVLSDDVKKIKFEYYDDNRHEWVEEWDTRRERDRLPERVRITITSVDENGKDINYSTEARLFMRLPIQHS
ncbi:MAG: prepilin-type N-terminal cleavage/methylation domain-containing protein [Deltaproteobacteria bacterium]|nr:prepilin-type N-terminal cleavage/methylation domain-containing protein [Deltaproteobacteria bacterium]